MNSLQKAMEHKFGEVSWCGEDVAHALEEKGFAVTAENIEKVIDHCGKISDSAMEPGWAYIGEAIHDVSPGLTKEETK